MALTKTITLEPAKEMEAKLEPVKDIEAKDKESHLRNSYKTLWGLVDVPLRFSIAFMFFGFHVGALVTICTIPFAEKIKTILWMLIIAFLSILGVTAGAHRLWSHRSYKANLPLKIFLAAIYHFAGQSSLYNWVRTHQIHHKYADTDADPHNIRRGFVYAHVGWFMMEKHPEYLDKGQEHNYGGVLNDPVLLFTKKYYQLLNILFLYVIPMGVPMYFWGETFYWALMTNMLRFVICVHPVLSINSFAHMFGDRPYDKKEMAVQNRFVSVICHGEGWHNYHHAFPWDYKAAEFGQDLNFTAFFIELCAKIGWAYDLKSPSQELLKKYVTEKGDGTHYLCAKQEVPEPEPHQSKRMEQEPARNF